MTETGGYHILSFEDGQYLIGTAQYSFGNVCRLTSVPQSPCTKNNSDQNLVDTWGLLADCCAEIAIEIIFTGYYQTSIARSLRSLSVSPIPTFC